MPPCDMRSAVAVIMAGGRGERLWPFSRRSCPKQFLDLDGSGSLLFRTARRITQLIPPERIFIVTVREYEARVRKELPFIPRKNIFLEPVSRNTAPCAGLAGAYISLLYPDATMVVLPADHNVLDEKKFNEVLCKAIELAGTGMEIVALGVEPTRVETAYGYIELGQMVAEDVYRAVRFVEKPDAQRAASFIRDGIYLWNSGIFVWKLPLFKRLVQSLLPGLFSGLKEIGSFIGTPGESVMVERVYAKLEPVSLDYGIMEKAGNILVVKCDMGWDDLGNWDSLERVLKPDLSGNVILGNVVELNTTGCIIKADEGIIGVIGVKDMVIVKNQDAVLVCPKKMVRQIKNLVTRIKDAGYDDLC